MSASILNLSSLNLSPMETLGDRAKKRREELKLKQKDVAARVRGMTASALSQLESGSTKGVTPQNLLDLARALDMEVEELVEGARSAPSKPSKRGGARRRFVPIIGFAIANPDEDGFFDDMGFPPGVGMGYLEYETRDPEAYAIQVKGDSMRPRIRPGEFIVVLPCASVAPEDDVLVKLKNGRKMVKQLIAQRKGEYTFGSVNQAYPHRTFSADEIEAVHKVDCIKGRSTNVKEDL